MMRKNGLFLLVLILTSFLTGCGDSSAPSPEINDRPTVALIMKSLANEFFVNMENGARQHQVENADRYDLIINGIKNESDLTQQVALVEQMTARGVDAIVIAPADSKALIPALQRAQRAGIVVINIDNKLDAGILSESGTRIAFVGPRDREGAKAAGEYLGQQLGTGDAVAIIGGISTAFNAQQRQSGFEDAMSDAGINVVSIQAGDWDPAKASTIAAALISEYPNLRGLLCSNDNMAMGAIAAVRQAGKTGDVLVVGFDNLNATHEHLRNGELLATVDQYGDRIAIHGIEFALQILNDGAVPEDQQTPVSLITADDI